MIETDKYPPNEPGKTADMIFFVLFGAGAMIITAYFLRMFFFLGPAMSFMMMYVWSRQDPHRPISLWGFAIQSWHLPYAMLVMAVLMRSSPLLDILGIFVGNLWIYLTEAVPAKWQIRLLYTPQFLYTLCDGQPAPSARGWGRGYRM
eukprot:CAMPEP_0170172710 /NCGR_PEP_ID=MMETSP0040_2-20121228/5967_1 /TAXON_ID=641309 /ORGANISM="Lotharella oceanica, Strain CCMP622" /LENGTH=146 /DNA_ID=CAMNT_0010413515 /DNA_START=271 /DNA_END=711 /DNA_ORIENTATION=-